MEEMQSIFCVTWIQRRGKCLNAWAPGILVQRGGEGTFSHENFARVNR